jgi:hypothetical protein
MMMYHFHSTSESETVCLSYLLFYSTHHRDLILFSKRKNEEKEMNLLKNERILQNIFSDYFWGGGHLGAVWGTPPGPAAPFSQTTLTRST